MINSALNKTSWRSGRWGFSPRQFVQYVILKEFWKIDNIKEKQDDKFVMIYMQEIITFYTKTEQYKHDIILKKKCNFYNVLYQKSLRNLIKSMI